MQVSNLTSELDQKHELITELEKKVQVLEDANDALEVGALFATTEHSNIWHR